MISKQCNVKLCQHLRFETFGEGALLLGINAAGDAIELSEILSDTAPAVVIPMTGKGDKQCDRGFNGGKKIGLFW